MSADVYSTRPLLDKLGVKPGSRVAVVGLDDPSFLKLLRERTADVITGQPRSPCDLVFIAVTELSELTVLKEARRWIEPNGAVWLVRPKGGLSELRDTDLIAAGLAAGLVDNKIASFSETHGAMRFVFRLRDRPR
jgi:hypothetical protein